MERTEDLLIWRTRRRLTHRVSSPGSCSWVERDARQAERRETYSVWYEKLWIEVIAYKEESSILLAKSLLSYVSKDNEEALARKTQVEEDSGGRWRTSWDSLRTRSTPSIRGHRSLGLAWPKIQTPGRAYHSLLLWTIWKRRKKHAVGHAVSSVQTFISEASPDSRSPLGHTVLCLLNKYLQHLHLALP